MYVFVAGVIAAGALVLFGWYVARHFVPYLRANLPRWRSGQPRDLRNLQLSRSRPPRKYLIDADLRGMDLTEAVLDGTIFEGARFDDATMTGVSARHTHLAHAKLRDCKLTGADFSFDRQYPDESTTANYAQFSRSVLDEANLSRARLAYAQFDAASLREANLSRAVLIGASFDVADLRGADLRFADLTRCRLIEADLRGANLSFTNLSGANLERVVHDHTTIWRGTRYNQRTRWFDGSRRRAPIGELPLDQARPDQAP